MTWACGHQAFAHARALSPSAITTLLRQIELDRKTAYWGTPPHSHSLDGAESWLLSLQDWLGGTR